MFDGEQMAGPVPSLYSEDPDSTLAGILSDPLKCNWDLNKIYRAFFMAEAITQKDALTFMKKPRYNIL